MGAITAQREAGGRDRFDCAQPVAFNTGHLNQPFDRITGHTQMMLKRNFGCIFNLFRGAAQNGA